MNQEIPETRVVKLKRSNKDGIIQGCDVYIGRNQNQGGWKLKASMFENPFSVKQYGLPEAMRLFREHLNKKIKSDPNTWITALYELHGKVLGCWCKPDPCHGDILKEYADHIYGLIRTDLPSGKWDRVNQFIASLP